MRFILDKKEVIVLLSKNLNTGLVISYNHLSTLISYSKR